MIQKNWLIKFPNPQLQAKLSDAFDIHPLVAQLLINREINNVRDAEDFLYADISRLHDPFLLTDMEEAVGRIKQTKEKKEPVLIFGDYDADGVTSSAILKNTLNRLGISAFNYIPHRLNEGYGLNHTIRDFAKEKNIKLIIAIDCGITAFDQIATLRKQGIDVIVIDHHEPTHDRLPLAVAIVNPKRRDCSYPFKGLASAGLAFKLSQALLGNRYRGDLDLVAVGTIADVAELNGENRIFAKEGLKELTTTKNKGLLALMEVARIKGKKIRPSYVGFILGPRLNAAGRIGSAEKSLKLLLSDNFEEAYQLAKALEEDNDVRQRTQNSIIEEALSIVEREVNFKDHCVIVLSQEGWHRGVVGIVASRLTEMYYRPAVVISLEDKLGMGSARSIDRFHIFEALMNSAHLLENFGGHKHAAGITIRRENIDAFRQSINEFARDTLKAEDLVPVFEIDCEVSLSDLTLDLVKQVEALEPYGEGNPVPYFCSRCLKVRTPPVVLGKDTLKCWLTDGKVVLQTVGFQMAPYIEMLKCGRDIDVVYSLSVDEWDGEPSLQLNLKDIRFSRE